MRRHTVFTCVYTQTAATALRPARTPGVFTPLGWVTLLLADSIAHDDPGAISTAAFAASRVNELSVSLFLVSSFLRRFLLPLWLVCSIFLLPTYRCLFDSE